MRGALPALQAHHRAHWEAETVTLLKCYPTCPLSCSADAPTSAVQLSSLMPVNPKRKGWFSFCCQHGHQLGPQPWSHTQSVKTDLDASGDIATSRLLKNENLWWSPLLGSGSPKPSNTYFTIPFHPGQSWGLKSARTMPADLILISTRKVQEHQKYEYFHSILLCIGI